MELNEAPTLFFPILKMNFSSKYFKFCSIFLLMTIFGITLAH